MKRAREQSLRVHDDIQVQPYSGDRLPEMPRERANVNAHAFESSEQFSVHRQPLDRNVWKQSRNSTISTAHVKTAALPKQVCAKSGRSCAE